MTDDLYCKIYLNAAGSRDDLVRRVASVTGGVVSGRSVETGLMVLDVVSNDSANAEKSTAIDGYVYFSYYLEIEPTQAGGLEPQHYVLEIRDLMSKLRSTYGGQSVVAACNFEEQLSDG